MQRGVIELLWWVPGVKPGSTHHNTTTAHHLLTDSQLVPEQQSSAFPVTPPVYILDMIF